MGGGSLGGGSSKSSSQSTQQAESYGYQGSQGSQVAQAVSDSVAGGTSTSQQQIAFQDLFQSLFSNASGAAGKAVAMGAPELAKLSQQLFSGGINFLDTLQGNAGTDYMTDRLSSDDSILNEQIGGLQQDIGRFFSDEINPAISGEFIRGGGLGGSRQAIAQGEGARIAGEQFTRGATALRVADRAAKDNVAANLAGNLTQASAVGLSGLSDVFDAANRGVQSELGIFGSLSQILGGPTTLTSSNSSNFAKATSQSLSEAFSRAFGEDFAKSSGQSSSRSNAWNFETSGYFGVGGG